jgi:hypothetical protein
VILYDIEDIELKIDQFDEKKGVVKRVHLKEPLKIGQWAYVGESNNKIKRISENEYMFIRKDSIDTHIEEYNSSQFTVQDVYQSINKKLDYDLRYGKERTKLVSELIENNQWIYNLKSTNRIIAKENKKKNSFLAEDQSFDKVLDKIATYIVFAKFKDEQDELDYQNKIKEKNELEQKGIRKRTMNEDEKLKKLINQITTYHHKLIKKVIKFPERIELAGNVAKREEKGDFVVTEEIKERTKKAKFTHRKDDISDTYWDKMYPSERKNLIPFYDVDIHNESSNKSILAKEFRKETLKQMKNDLDQLAKYLGLDITDKDKKRLHIKKLREHLNELFKDSPIDGDRRYNIMRKMYTDLKADYEEAKRILTNELRVNADKCSTVYAIDSDTWYENENGEIVEISKNRVLMSDVNTYKGLILTYKDLKDKYNNKQDSDIWALLMDFEKVLNNTKFTNEEQFVLSVVLDGYSQKQIRDMYKKLNTKEMNERKISNMINNTIPNKLLNTYLEMIDEWLYTYKIKGEYKKCVKCGEIKLISNDRYFGKDPRNKDGFKSICKKCDNYTKNRKKFS